MTAQDIQQTLDQLESIQTDARTMRATVAEQAPHLDIQPALTRIWITSLELQRRLCTKQAVDGLLDDAEGQMDRVLELINEYDGADGQLDSIGCACALVADKVTKLRQIERMAAQIEVLTGEAISEGA